MSAGAGMVLLTLPAAALAAPVPKYGLTLEELAAAYGSRTLVEELRSIGALMPAARKRQAMLFDAGEAARVWAEFVAGKYDGQLATWRAA